MYVQADRTAAAAVAGMKQVHAQEYDGLWFWDGDMMAFQPEVWNIVRRLGNKAEATALPDDENAYPKMKRTKILTIGDHDFSKTVSDNVPGGWPPRMLTLYPGG